MPDGVGGGSRRPPPVATREEPSGALLGYAAVAGAAALWAVAAVVARHLFDEGVDPVELTEARSVLTAAGFAFVPSAWQRGRGPGRGLVVGLGLGLALLNVTYYTAISRIPVAVAVVLQYTAPALVVGWASATSRRAPAPGLLAALAAALVGVVLVMDVTGAVGGRIDGVGVAMGLAAALCFASCTVLLERTREVYGSSGAMFRCFAVASVVWLAYQVPRGAPEELVARSNLPEVLYVGLAGTLAPFLLYAWGIGRVRAERAAIAATLEPVLAAMVAWVWLGQRLSPLQIVGGALVLAAVASLQPARRRPLATPDG